MNSSSAISLEPRPEPGAGSSASSLSTASRSCGNPLKSSRSRSRQACGVDERQACQALGASSTCTDVISSSWSFTRQK
jgi:hypothetical protein